MKIKRFIIFISLAVIASIFFNCEKDDICTNTPITPLLVVAFMDNDNNIESKSVNTLQVKLLSNNKSVFEPETVTTTEIPLANFSNETTYVFTRNFGDENPEEIDIDTLTFRYSRNNEYINRACGFRTTYSDLKVDNLTTDNPWIKRILIEKTTVNDQTSAHVIFFH